MGSEAESEKLELLEVSRCTHQIARAEDGSILINNNVITLENILDGTTNKITVNEDTMKELTQIFGFSVTEKLLPGAETAERQKDFWSRNATLSLISLYEKYEDDIKSTKVTNETVFANIAKDLQSKGHHYNGTQCFNKFKYLKVRYKKYKDALKAGRASSQNFAYAEEFNRLFGQPNIVQPPIGSSPRAQRNIARNNCKAEVNNVSRVNSKKENGKRKRDVEEDVERRHRERMRVAERAIKSFETMMTALIEKL